jgi:hypothetical protein
MVNGTTMLSPPALKLALSERAAAGREALSADRGGLSTSFAEVLAAGTEALGETSVEGDAEAPLEDVTAVTAFMSDAPARQSGKILPVALPVLPEVAAAQTGATQGGAIQGGALPIVPEGAADAGTTESRELADASADEAGGLVANREALQQGLLGAQLNTPAPPVPAGSEDLLAEAAPPPALPLKPQAGGKAIAADAGVALSPAPAPSPGSASGSEAARDLPLVQPPLAVGKPVPAEGARDPSAKPALAPTPVGVTVRVETAEAKSANAISTVDSQALVKSVSNLGPAHTAVAPSVPAVASLPAPAALATSPVAQPAAPADLAAVLDRLVAAREAVLPAQASLQIRHADFGDVSVRFAQSSQGALTVELAAADPELQRAVGAALSAERTQPGGGDGESHRSSSGGSAHNRDSASEREAANGRDRQPRQDTGRSQARPPAHSESPPRPGVFA